MNFGGTIRLNRMGVCIIIGAGVLLVLYINSSGMESPKTETGKNTGSVNLRRLLVAAIEVAIKGGKEVAAVRNAPHTGEKSKGKTKEGVNDPVTKADYNSHCVMYYSLLHSFPKIKIISEENTKEADCKNLSHLGGDPDGIHNLSPLDDQFVPAEDITVWIDPLDATKEFTENALKYVTTMVCVAVKGTPIIGVIHKPFEPEPQTFWAWKGKGSSDNLKNKGSSDNLKNKKTSAPVLMRSALLWGITQRQMVNLYRHFKDNVLVPSSRVKKSPEASLDFLTLEDGTDTLSRNAEQGPATRIIMSISHQGLAKNISEQAFGKSVKTVYAAGAGYKSLEVANRHVDAYLHVTEIKKWDICAGNAIINFLGGKMTTLSNELLYYSSEDDIVNQKGLLATMEKHEWYLEKLKPFKV